MTWAWLPLALLCAFSLATADALTKRWLTALTTWQVVVVRFAAPGVLLAPLLMRPWPDLAWEFWRWLILLVPLEFLAMLLYMRAIRSAELGLTLPYLAFTPVFSAIIAGFVLGERLTAQGFAGVGLVTLGAYVLNLPPADAQPARWWGPLRSILAERGARLMLAVAVIYGVTSVLGKAALGEVGPEFFGPFYFALLGSIAVAATLILRRDALARLTAQLPAVLAVGLALGVMVWTHFLAIAAVEVAYFIAVKRASLLFGIAYGALLFHEPQTGRRLLAGAIMVAGVALVSAASS